MWTSGRRNVAIRGQNKKMKCIFAGLWVATRFVRYRRLSAKYTVSRRHTRLTALFPGLPVWAGTRKVKPIWILLKQEMVSGSGISWATCKSAPRSRQITTPAPYYSLIYRPDALPAAQPTASKHCRCKLIGKLYLFVSRFSRPQVSVGLWQHRAWCCSSGVA